MPEKTDAEKLKDQEAEIAKLKADATKADERVTNAEKKFNEWSNEVGGIRKVGDELKSALEEAKKAAKELQDLIAAIKGGKNVQPAPGGKSSEDDPAGGAPKEKPEDIEKVLTDDQRKAVEAAFARLAPAEKLRYENDLEFRLAFLKRAQEAAPVIPDSPWKTAPKKTKPEDASGVKSILDEVFSQKRRKSFVPGGPLGGAPVLGGGNDQQEPNEPPEDSRVH
jgi:hypothetical protein